MSPGGVNMRTGQYAFKNTDLSIGGDGGLSLVREGAVGLDTFGLHHDRFGTQFGHNWDIYISEQRVPVVTANSPAQYDYLMTVHHNGLGTTFRSPYSPINFVQQSNDGQAILTWTGTPSSAAVYTFTGRDGTAITFRPINSYDCTLYYRCAYATKVTEPTAPPIRSNTTIRPMARPTPT